MILTKRKRCGCRHQRLPNGWKLLASCDEHARPTRCRLPASDDGETWRERAACKGRTAIFYPEYDGRSMPASAYDAARTICAGCSVREPCLDDAMRSEHGARYGFRGGLSPRGRDELAARRRRLA